MYNRSPLFAQFGAFGIDLEGDISGIFLVRLSIVLEEYFERYISLLGGVFSLI